MFSYEPLAVHEVRVAERNICDDVAGRDISYASPMGGAVTATVLTPKATAPSAGMLMMHWGFGNRLSFLSEAAVYARSGAMVLLIDAPGAGGRGRRLPALDKAEFARPYLIQCVSDLRRGVDLLLQRGTNGMRIGYVGHSLGAAVGVPFCGIEDRLTAAVLMTPLGDLSHGGWSLSPDRHYRETMKPLDGTTLIGDARCELYFQFATRDPWVDRGAAARLCAAAPKARQDWYEADHRLSPAALRDRVRWLCKQLGLAFPIASDLSDIRLPHSDLWRHWVTAPLFRAAKRFASGARAA